MTFQKVKSIWFELKKITSKYVYIVTTKMRAIQNTTKNFYFMRKNIQTSSDYLQYYRNQGQ